MNAPLKPLSGIPVRWRDPFGGDDRLHAEMMPEGLSVAEIVDRAEGLPEGAQERLVVCVNGEVVPRERWADERPPASMPDHPVTVTLHLSWGGSGSKGTKSVIGLVASIALTLVTAGIASGSILGAATGLVGTSLGIGATAFGRIVAGAVGLLGSLALRALTASPASSSASSDNTDAKGAASASGNTIDPGGAIPRVLGTHRVYPPIAGSGIVDLDGDDEVATVIFMLNGPHKLEDIRIGDTALADAEDVTYELREGWEDDLPLETINRYGYLTTPQIQMSAHTVDSSNQAQLKHQGNPAQDLPLWHTVASRKAPDEIWLDLLLPAGLNKAGDTSNDMSIPIRVRMRKRGDVAWINLPEVHVSDHTQSSIRKQIKLIWGSAPETIPSCPTRSGFIFAAKNFPGQGVDPASVAVTLDGSGHFSKGAGSDYFYNGVEGSCNVQNIALYDNRAEFYLDDATFPRGIYEIQVKRGAAYDTSNFTKSGYSYSGTVYDFFGYYISGGARIPMSRENLSDQVYLQRVQSIRNTYPIGKTGLALIAVTARNRAIENLSVLASGYVQDWDGAGWNAWTTTRYPAAHYRDVLSGLLNRNSLPSDIRDDDALVAWRQLCIDNGWTCDTIIEDMRTQDVLDLLAGCGYAKPYQSETYAVTVDSDRSSDVPVQVFTPHNTSGLKFSKAFDSQRPDGLVCTFRDRLDDYNNAQTFVYRRDYGGGAAGLLESVTYDGLVDEDKVIARAQFDLDQSDLRMTDYSWTADFEALVCRRGDLVAVQHDAIDLRAGTAIVQEVMISGGNITGLRLDNALPVVNEVDMHAVADMHVVANMHDVGVQTGIAVRHVDGSISTHRLSDATGETGTVTLATPFADDLTIIGLAESSKQRDGEAFGSLVASGPVTQEYIRLLVTTMKPTSNWTIQITAVDEAPDLVRYAA
jgi:hypothetical protein